MASVGLEPQLVHDTACCHYHYTTRSLLEDSRNLFTLFFSLACVLNNRHIPSHKKPSVGLEPQLVHETSLLSLPLDHLLVVGSLAQLIRLIFSLACIIKIQQFLNHKTASVGLDPQQVHDTSLLSLPLDHLLVVDCLT
jgi:hypothetical protein